MQREQVLRLLSPIARYRSSGSDPIRIARAAEPVLSLRSNRLSGEIPHDFSNLTHLRSLYLQHNEFSGGFSASVTQLTGLIRLDISSNNFTGPIPFSVNSLTQLTGLFLGNNRFSGTLPSISVDLADFNVSNNNLDGSLVDLLEAKITFASRTSFINIVTLKKMQHISSSS